jgi:23S rRNA (cytosine1962-C5)-methyltransferase
MSAQTVTVSKRGAERVLSGHPWIYRTDVLDARGVEPGAVVRIEERRRRFLAQAFYSSTSQIALRVLTLEERPFDRAFLAERLAAAASFREQVAKGAQAFRMVSSEGDQLPSLTVDRYGSVFVLQTLSQGTERLKPQVVEILQEAFSPRSIVERNDVVYRELEGLEEKKGTLAGENLSEVEVDENGLRFVIDLLGGQKTGGYLDQRENRLAAREYGRGRALDCFCYTGGFALNLARCCDSVLGVDSSTEALDMARRNQRLNGLGNVEWQGANCFDFLKAADQQKQRYDTIVLDPPPFARQRSNLEAARRGYKELNLRALKILNPGGFLLTCSCSHHLSEADLLEVVAEAALDAHRTVMVVERRTQARDHPILLTVPETHYLKCLILRVA